MPMELDAYREAVDGWDPSTYGALIEELQTLRTSMLDFERRLAPWLSQANPAHAASARNLAHYLGMRRHDMRHLQERLARLGLSSLGRAETHVLANLDKVLGILHLLTGQPWTSRSLEEPVGYRRGRALLKQHAKALFGPEPAERSVHIMVTLPSEAASNPTLVGKLVQAGMNIARINCAHDGPDEWAAMASHVRRAARHSGRPVRVLMDLAGPKIRTGAIEPGPAVLKLKPARDTFGLVTAPALLGLRPFGATAAVDGANELLSVEPAWLAQLQPGDRIDFTDARASVRRLTVLDERPGGVLVRCDQTAYLTPETRLRVHRRDVALQETAVQGLPVPVGRLRLHRGETLRLTPDGTGQSASHGSAGSRVSPATVSCTLPEVLTQVRQGERIWFDDGRIGGVIRRRARLGAKTDRAGRTARRITPPMRPRAESTSLPTRASTCPTPDSNCRR
jgi:pyruvate kinase